MLQSFPGNLGIEERAMFTTLENMFDEIGSFLETIRL